MAARDLTMWGDDPDLDSCFTRAALTLTAVAALAWWLTTRRRGG